MKKVHGWMFLTAWAVLIIAGIVAKRMYGHPDWMVFFHLPAAVALVLSFYILSADYRMKYQEELKRMIAERKAKQRSSAQASQESS